MLRVGWRANTYQWLSQPSIIEHSAYRIMEVVQVDLASGLKFVKEVE